MTLRKRLRIYALETKYEILRLARNRSFVVFTVGFPLIFYIIFGQAFGRMMAYGDVPVPIYMVATFGAFGVIGLSMFSFGIVIAAERHSWLILKHASPMPPEAYLIAKLLMAFLFNLVYIIILFVIAAAVGGARLSAIEYVSLGSVFLSGTIPFAALGFGLAYLSKDSRTAQGVANMIHMPMAFAAGLWMPLNLLPDIFGTVAPYLPHYHFGQLALAQIGGAYATDGQAFHVAVLFGYTLLFFGLAIIGYKRDQAILQS